jgi:predicted transcriptional regulator
MPKPFRDVTDAELAVLASLWDHGASTIREIADRLYPRGSQSDYATVHKLLERLCEKGCSRRERRGASQVFSAAIDRESLIAKRLEGVANDLCEGSMTPLLTHLVKIESASPRQREALRKLVDELARSRGKDKPGGRKGPRP